MLLKREVYTGNKDEKYFEVINKLKKAGLKYDIKTDSGNHGADIGRGAAVGRFGQTSSGPTICSVYVKKKDYDAAVAALHN